MNTNTKKTEIIDIDTACALLGCSRANMYGHYLKNKTLNQVPRVGRKAYFYYDEVNKILNERLADIAARKNLRLTEVAMNKLVTDDFKNKYTELAIKH